MTMNEQTKRTNGATKKHLGRYCQTRTRWKRIRKKNERNSCRQWHTIFLILLFWNSLLNPRKQQDCSLANKSNPMLGLAYFVAAILSILHHWFHPVWFCSMIGWTRYARQTKKWTNGRTREKKTTTSTESPKQSWWNPCIYKTLHTNSIRVYCYGCIILHRSFSLEITLFHVRWFTKRAHDIHNSAMYRVDQKLSDETNVKAICI